MSIQPQRKGIRRRVFSRPGVVVAGLGLLIAAAASTRAHRRHASGIRFRFNPSYREYVTLVDGSRARIRLLRPGDKRLLREGMRLASDETRYRRFHVPKRELTDQELRYLTEIDGENHFAIGAERTGRRPAGLGIARFVRCAADPTTAEAAIAVRDDVQRHGLGSLLFRRLMEAAQERGIERLYCDVLADNSPALTLLRALSPTVSETREGPSMIITIPVPRPAPARTP